PGRRHRAAARRRPPHGQRGDRPDAVDSGIARKPAPARMTFQSAPSDSSVALNRPDSPACAPKHRTRFGVIGAVSFVHVLNDMMQSVIVAIYPLLKGEFHLGFLQIGLITLTFQLTASLLQPVVGMVTDK